MEVMVEGINPGPRSGLWPKHPEQAGEFHHIVPYISCAWLVCAGKNHQHFPNSLVGEAV